MADSLITKQALASALKDLLKSRSFEKISINEICKQCGMHRMSFYYHFRDIHELVIWIFDTEFSQFHGQKTYYLDWLFLYDMCTYMYEHRDFYRKVMKTNGYDPLYEHILSMYCLQLREWIQKRGLDTTTLTDDILLFLGEVVIITVKRWITEIECLEPKEFLNRLSVKYNWIRTLSLNDEEFENLGMWSMNKINNQKP